MKDQKKNNKGFSLVELIVVVAIMAVLLGVLVPTLVRNVEKSKKQKDISNLSELRSAIQTTMASEAFSGLTGTLTFSKTNGGFTVNATAGTEGESLTWGADGSGATKADFMNEVLANLNGGTDYNFTYTSKIKDATSADVIFTFSNEKVTGSLVVSGCSKSEYNTTFQLQDAAQSSTVAP